MKLEELATECGLENYGAVGDGDQRMATTGARRRRSGPDEPPDSNLRCDPTDPALRFKFISEYQKA